MSLLEQAVRRYEHRRWTRDNNRRSLPFAWGLEHLDGPAPAEMNGTDPRRWLEAWAERTIASSDDFYAAGEADDYRLDGNLLTFTSAVRSPWEVNNRVTAQWHPAARSGPAVLVLPHWNARWEAHGAVCRWLNTLGLSALRMSMPYHDRRAVPGHERADHLVGPNIGLTAQASRQAVVDARRCLRWLERMGYTRLGILGTSIGSSVGFIVMAHDPAVRAAAFLHVSTYFGEVVRTGLTTMHVWESLAPKVTAREIRRFWEPVSPMPYVERVARHRQRMLIVTGRYDAAFWPEFSEQMLARLGEAGVRHDVLRLACGHYTLEVPPFSYLAGFRFGTYLFEALA